MNVIDIVILCIIAFAIFQGVRDGLIMQGLSILGVIIGIWLASKWGGGVASMLGIKGEFAAVAGFVIVLILSVIAISIGARLIRKVLSFAGLGMVDNILGAVLSVCKYLLILSFLFAAFNLLNSSYNLVNDKAVKESKLFTPIANLSKFATPAWHWTQEQIGTTK